MKPLFEKDAIVLFQGDSITDAGRDYNRGSDCGTGYAMMAANWFSALYPELKIKFLNRGISGNNVLDLMSRWEKDCIELQPNWVSILIGINDTVADLPINQFEEAYRDVLTKTKKTLYANLIIMEPFLIPIQSSEIIPWRDRIAPRIEIARKMAREFEAIFIPLDGVFAEACAKRDPEFWSFDGVHPTHEGHALMAQSWLHAVKAI